MKILPTVLRAALLSAILATAASAQFPAVGILGAGHPELDWYQIETEHFTIVYHTGLDSVAMRAAPMAEEVYRVVTTNLKSPLSSKVRIYLSDNDEVKNAFAFGDYHIFIWLRGILDDLPLGLRSSGSSKWLRTVLTHEFTHIVVASATKDWSDILFLHQPNVPRWFNEGLARFMEPDGFTEDLDALLRVATVNDELDLGASNEFFNGALVYEGGQSFVREIAARFGDSTIVHILQHRGFLGLYDFDEAVRDATGSDLHELYRQWHKRLTVYYASAYGQKQETEDYGRKIRCKIPVILAARLSPDGAHIALIGKRTHDSPPRLYVQDTGGSGDVRLVSNEPGIEPYLSWYPGGKQICISKMRLGTNGDLLHDLYSVDVRDGSLSRLTSDGRFEEPDVSAAGGEVVAVHTNRGHSDLELIADDGSARALTTFNDPLVQVYSPRWSPDGTNVAFSIFRKNGKRDVAIVSARGGSVSYLTDDSLGNRSPMWSPDGTQIVYTSSNGGTANLRRIVRAGGTPVQLTDAAGANFGWDWSKQKDSILVTSFDRRGSVALYWVAASQKASPSPAPSLAKKYTLWHDVSFDLITRPEDSIAQMAPIVASSYHSLAHIYPLFVFPLVSSDKGQNGASGERFGLTAVAVDPMAKHIIAVAADYGSESREFGGFLHYTNNQLRQSVSVELTDVIGFHRVIDFLPYYQRTKEIGLEITEVFPASNTLTDAHSLEIEGRYRSLAPKNLFDFRDSSFSSNHTPISYAGLEMRFGYGFVSELFNMDLSLRHADEKLDSKLTYSRIDFGFAYHIPFNEDRTVYLGFRGISAVQLGAQIPQEYIGFTTDEVFEQGFSPVAIRQATRLRGIRRPYYGDRLVLGSAELVFPDMLFGAVVPLVGAFDPAFVGFYDIGSVWYDRTPSNFQPVQTTTLDKTHWLQSFGIELRIGAEHILTAALGLGYENRKNPPPDWYFRINKGF